MSELKTFDITVAEEGYFEGIVKYRRHVYDKSEVDKVIAHQKYKRCLAMARTCKRNRLDACVCGPVEKIDFWEKWRKRWLELAEKFKEAKFPK